MFLKYLNVANQIALAQVTQVPRRVKKAADLYRRLQNFHVK